MTSAWIRRCFDVGVPDGVYTKNAQDSRHDDVFDIYIFMYLLLEQHLLVWFFYRQMCMYKCLCCFFFFDLGFFMVFTAIFSFRHKLARVFMSITFMCMHQRFRIRPLLPCDVISSSLRKHAYSNILKILPPKKWKFSDKNSDIFHNSAQNIDCGYSLEPPRRGGSNEYPQSMFLSRNKKNNVYPCKPQFYYIKVGFKGVNII